MVARGLTAEALRATVRGGTGTEGSARGWGIARWRLPGALRVGPCDDRDEIIMGLPLCWHGRREAPAAGHTAVMAPSGTLTGPAGAPVAHRRTEDLMARLLTEP